MYLLIQYLQHKDQLQLLELLCQVFSSDILIKHITKAQLLGFDFLRADLVFKEIIQFVIGENIVKDKWELINLYMTQMQLLLSLLV
jgi:hypothetical protein